MHSTLLEAARAKKFGTLRKHENFFDAYDVNFRDYRGQSGLRILEIGVQDGGSLAMWREYFDDPYVVGLDIDPSCRQWERARVRVYIGNQKDGELLREINKESGPFDIIVDDGGHTMAQQKVTFSVLFPLLREGGVYVIEDLHTSYWPEFSGGKYRPGTTIRFLKGLIDQMHFRAIQSPRASILRRVWNKFHHIRFMPHNVFQATVRSMYITDSIVFIRKSSVRKDTLLKF